MKDRHVPVNGGTGNGHWLEKRMIKDEGGSAADDGHGIKRDSACCNKKYVASADHDK